jgi:microcystin-dependent protein
MNSSVLNQKRLSAFHDLTAAFMKSSLCPMQRYQNPQPPIHVMKKIKTLCWLCWAGVALALVLVSIPAQAANSNPPDLMTYQGYLVDNNGNTLGSPNPKNYDVVFRIWSDQAPNGNKLWTEQQTITVDNGYFSLLLGEGASYSGEARPALSSVFAAADAADRYIEIMVKGIGTGGTDLTIAPRLRLLTAPYAFLARTAVNAQNLANSTSAQIVTVTSTNVGINKTSPNSALDVNGTATTTGLAVSGAAGVNSLTVTNNANLSGGANISGTAGINTLRVTNNETVGGTLTVTGALTAASFSGYGTIPIGGIIMWSGSISTIPTGWALCNGATVNNRVTPNLLNRFVVGAGTGSDYNVGDTGGTNSVTLTLNQIPPHSHTYSTRGQYDKGGGLQDDHWRYTATGNTGSAGSGQAHENRPPYYALCYIMRVQ